LKEEFALRSATRQGDWGVAERAIKREREELRKKGEPMKSQYEQKTSKNEKIEQKTSEMSKNHVETCTCEQKIS
jgi:hypothetical protein